MTKQEFDLKYSDEKVVVHCNTEEKAKALLKLAKSFGYKWESGEDLENNNYWENRKEKTCYRFYETFVLPEKHYELFVSRSSKRYYKEKGYTIVEFELEKENNMKFKVGQKVRVKTDLEKNNYYGDIFFNKTMESARGNVFTIGSDSDIEENMYTLSDFVRPDYYWSAEMFEPVTEEEFKVGDVVYDLYGDKAKIVDIKPCYLLEGYGYYVTEEQIKKVKPLKKITKEQLAEMGYEVEE